jgi:DNA repair ATPase RecN
MLTQEDIQKLKETIATKEDISRLSIEIVNIKDTMATKDDLEGLKEQFSRLVESIDNYAKKVDDYYQEMVAMNSKLNRHEKWIQQIADKLEIKLEY